MCSRKLHASERIDRDGTHHQGSRRAGRVRTNYALASVRSHMNVLPTCFELCVCVCVCVCAEFT